MKKGEGCKSQTVYILILLTTTSDSNHRLLWYGATHRLILVPITGVDFKVRV